MGLSDQLQFVGPLAVGFIAVTAAGAAITFYGLEQVPGDKGPPLVWLVLQTGVSIFIGAMGALHLLTSYFASEYTAATRTNRFVVLLEASRRGLLNRTRWSFARYNLCGPKQHEQHGKHAHYTTEQKLFLAGKWKPNPRGEILPANHEAALFADGSALGADVVVFSAGIRPQDSLARDAGLECGPRGGIVVDEHCRSSDPDVHAIGECALYDGRIFGLVAPGYRMAEAAAGHLTGSPAPFTGADMSTKLKLLGVDVGAIGDGHGRGEGVLAYTFQDPVRRVYKRLNVSGDGRRLLGAVLVGDCASYDTLLQYYQNALALPEAPESLLIPGSADVGLSGDALPDAATICSCHNVSKGAIVGAIDGGCMSIADVKAATAASTGCGGCAPLLKSLVDGELEARGLEADRSLCEHFDYTRQELFHLCQVEELRTYDELLRRHGRGYGCDICKPTAASILASLWNEHVLDDPHRGLQDTNDRFLANMQKDGTYSVVPRVPAGEITPDKLLVLGRVAKKYDLYTKITGGQRIDLFGARVDQLPSIWRELVEAGFETGHAYGKAVRTVKSCVGSTWCRYGVQDSVGKAIALENRYKGLRSPHKLKFAVSGCARECAEAQSKDIGVIATEHGWNLYVCGNGGMRPRHADLFATDLDDQTLIRYIDRLLMFYVRTADRLQRTSVWLENLEGGLDYLAAAATVGAAFDATKAGVRCTTPPLPRTSSANVTVSLNGQQYTEQDVRFSIHQTPSGL